MESIHEIGKALSIRQPWAWLIVNGYKDVENRSWSTRHRGPFLIHAGQKFDYEGYEWVKKHFDIDMPAINEFDRGGIVGRAKLVDCVTSSKSQWFTGPYGFILANARPLPLIPTRGKLGFFKPDL